jgi:hypothetical protein
MANKTRCKVWRLSNLYSFHQWKDKTSTAINCEMAISSIKKRFLFPSEKLIMITES